MCCKSCPEDAVAHGRAADGQLHQMKHAVAYGFQSVLQLRKVSGEFLSQSQWGGIHQVRASDFLDVRKLLNLNAVGFH